MECLKKNCFFYQYGICFKLDKCIKDFDNSDLIKEKISLYWIEVKLNRIIDNKKTVQNKDLIECLDYLNYKIESLFLLRKSTFCNKFYKEKISESIAYNEGLYEKCRSILQERKQII